MSHRGLGKGLDVLLSANSQARDKKQKIENSQQLSEGQLVDVAISQLVSGKYQPRKNIEQDSLEELSASIQAQGIIQPIVVRKQTETSYEIIAGERRWQAAKQVGLKKVPCVIKEVEDNAVIAMALIENIQRENLNAIEEAEALEKLQKKLNLTHQQLADTIGKSRASVSNLLRLNTLNEDVKHCVISKKLEMGHARALISLSSIEQSKVAKIVVDKHLSVRQTEDLVRSILSPKPQQKKEKSSNCKKLEEKLAQTLGVKVNISENQKGKGRLVISYSTPDELSSVLKKIIDF